MEEKYESVELCYAVHKYSSYSANYVPQYVLTFYSYIRIINAISRYLFCLFLATEVYN